MDRFEQYIYLREEMWYKLGENDFLADMSMVTAYLQSRYDSYITAFYRVVKDKLIIGPYQGAMDLKPSFEYGEGICGMAWKKKEGIAVPDPSTTKTPSPYSSSYTEELAIPVWRKGKIIAILDIGSDEALGYNEDDIFFIQNICNDLACGVNPSLRKYLDDVIYEEAEEDEDEDNYFDWDFWENVRDHALGLACRYEVDANLVYATVASYDRKYGEDRQNIGSAAAKALLEDEKLREWFTTPQINIIMQALEDQDLPEDQEPHSIYGKILADSKHFLDYYNALNDCSRSLKKLYPDLDREGRWEKFQSALDERYGPGGTFKLWLQESDVATELKLLQKFIADKTELRNYYNTQAF